MTIAMPHRTPINDTFHGVVCRSKFHVLLTITPLDNWDIVASGEFIIRYAIPYLEKPHLAIVPDLVVADYGQSFVGEVMWQFILTKNNRYPRADVIGYRNDGMDEMIPLKKLDLANDFQTLVFDNLDANKAITHVDALIAPSTYDCPSRLGQYLARYSTVTDWETHDVKA